MAELIQGSAKWQLLKAYYDRGLGNYADPSLTLPSAIRMMDPRISIAMAKILADELIEDQLMKMNDRGVRDRYQITSRGIHQIDRDILSESKSSSQIAVEPKNILSISENSRADIIARIEELRRVIEVTPLTNEERAQALAYATAAIAISEAPEPAWILLKEILLIIAAIAAPLSLALQIAGMIH